MKNANLKKFIRHLVEVEPTSSPLLSCFLDLDKSRAAALDELEARSTMTAQRLEGKRRSDFQDAYKEVREYLNSSLEGSSKSAAIYARWGENPVFSAMQFEVPLETDFVVDSLPHIYPLIQLKDTYHRFVIVITTETEARILETTIGAVTEEILKKRADLRERLGREWTREHYQNHKREREQQFIREKIRILDRLMSQRGHNHLIVAGSPGMVGRLTGELPQRLKEKLITTMPVNPKSGLDPILLESIQLFVAAENVESHNRVRDLESAVLRGGLGVAGYHASRAALQGGYADVLIVDQEDSDPELREELVRLAVGGGVTVETVNRNETLQRFGGAGCLLRYLPPEEWRSLSDLRIPA